MAPFRLRRREAGLTDVHEIVITPHSADGTGTHVWDAEQWMLIDAFSNRVFAWLHGEETEAMGRMGFPEIARPMMQECAVRFVPALARLSAEDADHNDLHTAASHPPTGSFRPPAGLRPDRQNPIEWETLRRVLHEESASDALARSLTRAGTTGEALRALCRSAVDAGRTARRARRLLRAATEPQPSASDGSRATLAPSDAADASSVEASNSGTAAAADSASGFVPTPGTTTPEAAPTEDSVAALEAAASRLHSEASALATAVRAELHGRVVVTRYNHAAFLCTDIDPVRSATSHMPRRSAREPIRSFADYLLEKKGLALHEAEQPLLAVGSHVQERCCLVDETDESARDRFTGVTPHADAPAEQQRHHTFLASETCTLTGFVAEMFADCIGTLLAELAWNLAVWQRLQWLEARLGYTFGDKALLREALTHRAYTHDIDKPGGGGGAGHGNNNAAGSGSSRSGEGVAGDEGFLGEGLGEGKSYERLEWLGDRALHALVSCHLFHSSDPSDNSHALHQRRLPLCSNARLHRCGESIGLAELLLLPGASKSGGRGAKKAKHPPPSLKQIADVVEALLGSIYLEGGLQAAQSFCNRFVFSEQIAPQWSPDAWAAVPASGSAALCLATSTSALAKLVQAVSGMALASRHVYLQHALVHPTAILRPGTPEAAAYAQAAYASLQPRRGATNAPPPPDDPTTCRVVWGASFAGGRPAMPHQFHRMEWLGDAVLDLVVADALYERFPDETEFHLSERKFRIVNNAVLSVASEVLGLHSRLLHDPSAMVGYQASRGARTATPKPQNGTKWLADVFETLCAAIYLEGGLPPLRAFVRAHLLDAVVRDRGCGEGFGATPQADHHGLASSFSSTSAGSGGEGAAQQPHAEDGDERHRSHTSRRPREAASSGSSCSGAPGAAMGSLSLHNGLSAERPAKRTATGPKPPKQLLSEALSAVGMGVAQYHVVQGRGGGGGTAGRVTVECVLSGHALGCGEGTDMSEASAAAAEAVLGKLAAFQAQHQVVAPSRPDARAPPGLPNAQAGPGGGGGSDKVHPKTALSQLVQRNPQLGKLEFKVVQDFGPAAPMRYVVGAVLGGRTLATGRAQNFKLASTQAAQEAYTMLHLHLQGFKID